MALVTGRQARALIIPVLCYLIFVGCFLSTGEWGTGEVSRHPWFRVSEMVVFSGFFISMFRRRMAANALS